MRRSARERRTMKEGFASRKCGSWYPFPNALASILSPPTDSASELKSSRVATTRSFAKAESQKAASMSTKSRIFRVFMAFSSERMGAMGADRELKLQENLVGDDSLRVGPAAQLTAKLRELARPEGQKKRLAPIPEGRIVGAVGGLRPGANEPAFRELIVSGKVPTCGMAGGDHLCAASHALAAESRGAIGGGAQRLPPVDRVHPLESCLGIRGSAVRPQGVREAQIQVGGFGQILENSVVCIVGQIAARRSREEARRLTPERLERHLGEDVAGKRDHFGRGDARADPALLSPEEVDDGQGLVGPGEHVQVERVDFSERGPHPTHLRQKARGEARESHESFLDADPFLAERKEEVGPGVRIHDGLEGDLRFPQLRAGKILDGVVPADAQEVPDHRDARVEVVGGLGRAGSWNRRLGRRPRWRLGRLWRGGRRARERGHLVPERLELVAQLLDLPVQHLYFFVFVAGRSGLLLCGGGGNEGQDGQNRGARMGWIPSHHCLLRRNGSPSAAAPRFSFRLKGSQDSIRKTGAVDESLDPADAGIRRAEELSGGPAASSAPEEGSGAWGRARIRELPGGPRGRCRWAPRRKSGSGGRPDRGRSR